MVVRMIRGEGVSKRFGRQIILESADFCVRDGEIVGLFGRSGIGKSTLAKLLCGLIKPDAGRIFADAALLASPEGYDRKLGLGIQLVYQQPYASLDPSQRVRAGLRELIRYHRFAESRAAAERLIGELAAEVGLDEGILEHLPRQLSGGEAQRVALARCLLFRPRLLILDEATSMLDVSTQANVLALVRRVMAQSGGSALLISHDRELVEALCQRVYYLEDGKLQQKGERDL